MKDLRILAQEAITEIDRLAEQWPKRSKAWYALQRARRSVYFEYVAQEWDREKLIMRKIGRGARTIADLEAETELRRREIVVLVDSMVCRGLLIERKVETGERGRPARWFELGQPGQAWFDRDLITNKSKMPLD